MLYVATLTYVRPLEEIDRLLEAHRTWLAEHYQAGHILISGPMEPRTGGLLLAHCENRAELDAMLAEDPFHTHRVAEYEVRAFNPSQRAAEFPSAWAPDAKAA